MTAKKNLLPPSRLRYEENNPVVSVRISKEDRSDLAEAKERYGLSLADLLKIGLEKEKPDLEDTWKKGHDSGWKEAFLEFSVLYRCNRCGYYHLYINTDDEKVVAGDALYEAGWEQLDCEPGSVYGS